MTSSDLQFSAYLPRRRPRVTSWRMLPICLLALVSVLLLACSRNDTAPTPTPTVAPSATSEPAPTATAMPALPPPPPISWRPCGSFECGDIGVPLDYADPARGEITLQLIRLPARDRNNRIGSLLVNPGGPGGSAVEFMRAWAFVVPARVKDRFDLVAFDPRGVGESEPVSCGVNIQRMLALDPDPETDEEWDAVVQANREFARACAAAAGETLPYYGTESVARDMDRIREGLGDDKLTYVGYSYGTSIGQVYADLFPQHVRAMVLDGALDNSLDADQRNLEQMLGFEAAFDRFLDYCRRTNCFGRDPMDAVQTLLDRAEASPIPAPGADRPLSEGEVVWGVVSSLYARFQWAGLANAISDALDGDGSRMLRLVDSLWGRKPDGSYPNFFDANVAVNCLDQAIATDPAHHRALGDQFTRQAPFFGSFGATVNLVCALWEVPPKPLSVPRAAGAPPILVIGNTGDAATPLKWAVALADQLESGVLLTNDAEGHTAYLQGDTCITNAVNDYLVELKVPGPGARCGNAGIAPSPPVP